MNVSTVEDNLASPSEILKNAHEVEFDSPLKGVLVSPCEDFVCLVLDCKVITASVAELINEVTD